MPRSGVALIPISEVHRHPRRHALALTALFVVSGFAALTYQVLWVRELGLLFGSTAQAASMAIAIFFAGLALGGWFWGQRAPQARSSLRWFGWVEVGVGITALSHFFLIDTYHALYPLLYPLVGDSQLGNTFAKASIAVLLLLPPAFLMGGTLPLMGQHAVRHRSQLGTAGTRLYAANTAGSAAGALAAGSFLPFALGFSGTYLLAIGLDLTVGLCAVMMARARRTSSRDPGRDASSRGDQIPTRAPDPGGEKAASDSPRPNRQPPDRAAGGPRLSPRLIWAIAGLSGLATLAIEVLWTRLFAQVLHNSVYTYALVLTTFLVALTLGAGLANVLARLRRVRAEVVLGGLLLLSAIAAATSPWLFHTATDGLAYVGSGLGWSGYLTAVATLALVVMLLPGTVLGAVLPYLLRTLEQHPRAPGESIGRLMAVNTTGSIVGSLVAGFVLLPLVGVWRALLLTAAIYLTLLIAVAFHRIHLLPYRRTKLATSLTAAAALVAIFMVDVSGFTTVRMSQPDTETVIDLREGPQAHVAVVARDQQLRLRVNNFYTLGGTNALHAERDQAALPLVLHPSPKEVFFLGMGTGITAGASLAFPVERVEVCELITDVVTMAETHFAPWTAGLFDDERARVYAEDGRTCLRRSNARYDVIISDLFTPWKAGTGNLYTYEHYWAARQRLHEGGTYVQWVPLYQVSEQELGIIANTMDAVFDEVLLYRGDLFASRSIVALVGHTGPAVIDPDAIVTTGRQVFDDHRRDDRWYQALALRMYAGNITRSGIFADAPINTDDRPLIEYLAPRTHREVTAGSTTFVVGSHREALYDRLFEALPIEEDPALAGLDPTQRDDVRAGRDYSAYRWHQHQGDRPAADAAYQRFLDRSPPDNVDGFSISRALLPQPPPVRVSDVAVADAG